MQAKVLCRTNNLTRDEWLGVRKMGIGGSDIAKIVGLSNYGNALTVYMDKINPNVDDSGQSEAAEIGNDLEEYVAKKFTQRTGRKVKRLNAVLQHPDMPWALANIDRMVVGEDAILECKTAGTKKEWEASDDSDEAVLPAAYYCQTQYYLGVTGLQKAYVGALLGGFGGMQVVVKELERDDEVIKHLLDAAANFWRMVEARTPPAIADNGEMVGLEFTPDPPRVILPDLLAPKIQRYRELNEQIKPIEKERDAIKDELNQIMECADPECESFLCGDVALNRKIVTVNRFDAKALQSENPEIYAAFVKETKQRRLSVK